MVVRGGLWLASISPGSSLVSFHHSCVRTEMSFGMEQGGEVIFSAKPGYKRLTLGCMCQGASTRNHSLAVIVATCLRRFTAKHTRQSRWVCLPPVMYISHCRLQEQRQETAARSSPLPNQPSLSDNPKPVKEMTKEINTCPTNPRSGPGKLAARRPDRRKAGEETHCMGNGVWQTSLGLVVYFASAP